MEKAVKRLYKQSLYRNSLYLIAENATATGLGFFFWMICARLFPPSLVGYATTIISAVGLISSFSFLGLTTALIRYLPKSKEKEALIGSCISLTVVVAVFASFVFLALIPLIAPKLDFIANSSVWSAIFIAACASWVLYSIASSIFIARRTSELVLAKAFIFGLGKLVIVYCIAYLGSMAVVGAYYLAALMAFGFSLMFFKFKPGIDRNIIRKILPFSFENYVAGLLGVIPAMALPIIITDRISADATAYYYVAWSIAGLLFYIPYAVSRSLLSEGSHEESELGVNIRKSYFFSFALLLPGILIILLGGKYLLLLFGRSYSDEGFQLLQVLSGSSVFVAVNCIRTSKYNILHQQRKIIWFNAIICFVSIAGTLLYADGQLIRVGLFYALSNILAWLLTKDG
jgi:O-antigen/teichoic acid export membrane protein